VIDARESEPAVPGLRGRFRQALEASMRFRHFLCALATVLVICQTAAAFAAAAEEDRFAPLKRFSQVMDLVENHYVKRHPR